MTTFDRLSEYRIMWLMVFFDLPVETKQQRKQSADFRKFLISDGFTMFQYSIYVRHCSSKENAEVHEQRVSKHIPGDGKVCVMSITDRQFSMIKIYEGTAKVRPIPDSIQLELF